MKKLCLCLDGHQRSKWLGNISFQGGRKSELLLFFVLHRKKARSDPLVSFYIYLNPEMRHYNSIYTRYLYYFLQIYGNICNLIFNQLGPLLVMIILNILIFKSLRNHRIMRRRKSSVNRNLVVQSLENRMTRVSVMIIGIFVICHLPRIIPNVYEVLSRVFPESEENFSIKIIKIVNILLLIVSSSVNFIIYFIIFGGGFCFGSSRNNTGR